MKYKVGDRLKVRGDLQVFEQYGEDITTPNMEVFFGKTVTIFQVLEEYNKYKIREDIRNVWTDEMFEGLSDNEAYVDAEVYDVEPIQELKKLRSGDIVIVREDLDLDMVFQGWDVTTKIKSFAGKQVTIDEVDEDCDGFYYTIKEDDGVNSWTIDMFAKYSPSRQILSEGIAKALKNFSTEQLQDEIDRRKREE